MPFPVHSEFQSLVNFGLRYKTLAEYLDNFEKQILELIAQGQIPSLAPEQGDKRGFRFTFAGQSYILRLNFEATTEHPQGIAHLALYALDRMDETKFHLVREFEIDKHGDVRIPNQEDALTLSYNGLLVFKDLLTGAGGAA
jgi:hypothetical protein